MSESEVALVDHSEARLRDRRFKIHVNNKPVVMIGHAHTGLEIKQTAVEQGVQICLDFVLSEELSHGRTRIVGDDERVTELGRLEDLNRLDSNERMIFGHCVMDATSTGPYQGPLIFHAPGFLTVFSQENPTFFAEASDELIPISDDVLYHARVRELDA